MIAFDQAREQLLSAARLRASVQRVPLSQALGKILAETVVSPVAVPPWDNSAVDGYALNHSTLSAAPMPVSQRIAAGHVPQPLAAATAARIFTGAPLPSGADCVVMQENCRVDNDLLVLLEPESVTVGDNIRPYAQDVAIGDAVLAAGEKLLPWHVGLLASVSVPEVAVYRPLRVAVLSTGDELQEPGEVPRPGKIFNSNRYQLLALLQQCGFDAVDGGRVADNAAATERALSELAGNADVVVTTGGVSVGDEDHVRPAVEKLGELALWKIAIKPGKPFAFGHIGKTYFVGLPGNPSAVLVTFLMLLKPFLDICQGRQQHAPVAQQLPASFSVKPGKRQEYLRVRVDANEHGVMLMQHPNQSSGMLSSACWADGLAVLPAGRAVMVGDTMEYFSFAALLS